MSVFKFGVKLTNNVTEAVFLVSFPLLPKDSLHPSGVTLMKSHLPPNILLESHSSRLSLWSQISSLSYLIISPCSMNCLTIHPSIFPSHFFKTLIVSLKLNWDLVFLKMPNVIISLQVPTKKYFGIYLKAYNFFKLY